MQPLFNFRAVDILKLLFLALVFTSCESGIDRDKANQLLNDTYGFPKPMTLGLISGRVTLPRNDAFYGGEKALMENGYRDNIIVSEFQDRSGSILDWDRAVVEYKLTPKASEYIKNTVEYPTYKNHTLQVGWFLLTGINNLRKVTDSEYEVEFEVETTVNSLGRVTHQHTTGFMDNTRITGDPADVKYRYKYGLPMGRTVIKQRIFKYDNGWQIASDDVAKLRSKMEPQKLSGN